MTPTIPSRSWLIGIAAMLTALFFWSVIPLILIYFTHLIDPWTANGSRYFFAAAFWVPFVLRSMRQKTPAARRAAWGAALAPAVAHILSQIFFGIAPYYNSATVMNFGCRLSIPFATLFGFWMLRGERPLAKVPLFWFGLLIALGSFFLMFADGHEVAGASLRGLLVLLGFAISWGLYVVFVRRNLSAYPAHLAYGLVSLLTGGALFVLMFAVGEWRALAALNLTQWLWLILSALLGLTLGHVFYYRAIRIMGPIAAESGMLLIPFQTAVFAALLLGERMTAGQWVAGLFLVLGCAVILRARFKVRG